MAFMMPVMKNDYNIYASRSRTSSNNSVTPGSRRHTQSESAPVSLSCSPGSDVEERLAAISLGCSPRRNSRLVDIPSPKSASQSSLHKFHNKVVEKLRRKLRPKEDDEQKNGAAASSSNQSSS
ncbi:hypothetical protein CDAR_617911 [Caerostris darwini]|uniref:Uncharacterized protein n=2 Tax=Caerostris TaxID=172845 RepID=A0AAV4TQR6_9ARAC|nr:hypothetical protein CEXT_372731 [Caerostris extrusa]GIY47282.1 hypothetical protein CDAR_617911 [Caerostris darwini]